MANPTVPDLERGDPGNLRPSWTITGSKQWEAISTDPNVDLTFPYSVQVYDRMSRTDGKVGAVLRAINLPLLRAKWDLDTTGCRDEVVDRVREDLGLPRPGERLPKGRVSKVVWTEHLREALKALVTGFSVFEQVYQVVDGQVHLRKLAPRLPSTIARILVAPDGGLEAVEQKPSMWNGNWQPVILPVDRVLVYSHDREGADWYGTSLLRTAYKDWLIKDELVRLNAQIIERNGMGVPVVSYQDESQRDAALALAEDWRAGATAGGAAPQGVSVQLVGVSGSTVDPLPSIREHDQNIAKAVLAMFLDLGHDNGARSLGDTFVDTFTLSLQQTADWIAATASEYLIRDLVDWAFGPDEPAPLLTAGDIGTDPLLPADMKALADGGLLTPDAGLEAWIRRQSGLPEAQQVELAPVTELPTPVLTAASEGSLQQRAVTLLERLAKLT